MGKTITRSSLLLLVTILCVTTITSQSLNSVSRTSPPLNKDNKGSTNPGTSASDLLISSPTNNQTVTSGITVSTYPQLTREMDDKIYFPKQSETYTTASSVSTKKSIAELQESSTYATPIRNPYLGISMHPPHKIDTSTHPPLIHHVNPPFQSGEVSTKSSNERTSTHPPLIHDVSQPFQSGEASTKSSNERTSTHPPLIHHVNQPFQSGEASTKSSNEITSTFPPLIHNVNQPFQSEEASTQSSNEAPLTHPPLIHEIEVTKSVQRGDLHVLRAVPLITSRALHERKQ